MGLLRARAALAPTSRACCRKNPLQQTRRSARASSRARIPAQCDVSIRRFFFPRLQMNLHVCATAVFRKTALALLRILKGTIGFQHCR
eukprot:5934467-Pyramimonas_sp.AAC.1